MKMRIIATLAMMLLTATASFAQTIQETASFTDIDHAGPIGDLDNATEVYTSIAAAPYRLFNLNWDGIVSPVISTTWGNDLRLHVTHDQSGREAFLLLAPGDQQVYPDDSPFSGSSSSLGGIEVSAGDTFTMEFWDSFDDGGGPDANWSTLDIEFEDIDIDPEPAVAADFIRIDTQGSNQFPTTPGSDGEKFWGITYGGDLGGQPNIDSIDIDLGPDPRAGFFDPFAEESGFVASTLNGVAGVTDTYSNPNEDFFEQFGHLHLDIDADDFGPGDSIRFGVDIDGLGTLGFQMRDNTPQPQITINFDNGTSVSGPLSEFGLDGDSDLLMSFIDLDVSAATGSGEGNIPEPSSLALLALALIGISGWFRQKGNRPMRVPVVACLALVCSSGSTFAADVQTFSWDAGDFITSEDVQGGPTNIIVTDTATSSFTLGDVNWDGFATAFVDPDDGGFPTFAGDLHVRVRHNPVVGDDKFFDMMLGHGANWHGSRSFTGSSPHMRGWEIASGDELSFEFFEGFSDLEFSDAIWDSLDITFTDDNNVAPAVTGLTPDRHVRVRAIGQDSFPVTARNADGSAAADSRGDGGTYWQIRYGADPDGTAPKITGVKFDLGDPTVMTFDRSALEGEPSVFFTDGSDESPSGLSIAFTNPDPDFAGAFGAMELTFDADDPLGNEDFLPGGAVEIGWDIDGAPFDAVDLADLASPIEITVTFDDGSTATGALDNRGYQGLFDVSGDGEDPLLTGMQYAYDFISIDGGGPDTDFNDDGIVDGDDFLIWQAGFGGPGDEFTGDANGDGVVDGDDFLLWQADFGGPPSGSGAGGLQTLEAYRQLSAGGTIRVSAVLEPASIALLAFGLLAAIGCRRR